MRPRSLYVSLDVYADEDGLQVIDYAQWDLTCAVRVHPVRMWTDPTTGEQHMRPETHDGKPLLSVMSREAGREQLRSLIEFVLGKL